jgi:hypothetical protein
MTLTAAQASRRLADLTAEVAQAIAEVGSTREALAEGVATAGDVTKAQRQLARLQERAENCRAEIRVCERREAVEQAHINAESLRIKSELRKIAEGKRQVKSTSFKTWLRGALADLNQYDRDLKMLDDQAGEHSGLVPSSLRAFRELTTALVDVIAVVDPPQANQEDAK